MRCVQPVIAPALKPQKKEIRKASVRSTAKGRAGVLTACLVELVHAAVNEPTTLRLCIKPTDEATENETFKLCVPMGRCSQGTQSGFASVTRIVPRYILKDLAAKCKTGVISTYGGRASVAFTKCNVTIREDVNAADAMAVHVEASIDLCYRCG